MAELRTGEYNKEICQSKTWVETRLKIKQNIHTQNQNMKTTLPVLQAVPRAERGEFVTL